MDEPRAPHRHDVPGPAPRDYGLPIGGPGPLNKGRRTIADVLDRAGQKERADYMRSLDMERIDQELDQRVRQLASGVRARPLVSILAAVVAGFVVGRVLRD